MQSKKYYYHARTSCVNSADESLLTHSGNRIPLTFLYIQTLFIGMALLQKSHPYPSTLSSYSSDTLIIFLWQCHHISLTHSTLFLWHFYTLRHSSSGWYCSNTHMVFHRYSHHILLTPSSYSSDTVIIFLWHTPPHSFDTFIHSDTLYRDGTPPTLTLYFMDTLIIFFWHPHHIPPILSLYFSDTLHSIPSTLSYVQTLFMGMALRQHSSFDILTVFLHHTHHIPPTLSTVVFLWHFHMFRHSSNTHHIHSTFSLYSSNTLIISSDTLHCSIP